MTFCDNPGCRHCALDVEIPARICTLDPMLIRVETLKGWMMKCNNYKYRPAGETLRPTCSSLGADGLYPGQLKPPADYSDVDPESVGVSVGEEPECDT